MSIIIIIIINFMFFQYVSFLSQFFLKYNSKNVDNNEQKWGTLYSLNDLPNINILRITMMKLQAKLIENWSIQFKRIECVANWNINNEPLIYCSGCCCSTFTLWKRNFPFYLLYINRYLNFIETWYSRAAHSFDTLQSNFSQSIIVINCFFRCCYVYLMDWNCWLLNIYFSSIIKS